MKPQTFIKIAHLVCYMSSAARGLLDEPLLYGPMRLIESIISLIEIIEEEGIADSELLRIKKVINQEKYGVRNNLIQLRNFLEILVIDISEWLDNLY